MRYILLALRDIEQLTLMSSQGTYWYHSHFKAQYCDGLRGPLVIYDPYDPHLALYDVDDGKIVGGKELFTRLRLSRREHRYHPCGLVPLPFDGTSPNPVSQNYFFDALVLTYA